MNRSTVVALASAALFGASAPSHALFEINLDPQNYEKLFLNQGKNVTSFNGTVGAQFRPDSRYHDR